MRYDLIFLFINHLIIGPLQCCFTIYFLWGDYGYSSLGGIGVVVCLAILQSFQSRIFYKLRIMTAKRSDARIKIVDEMISAMRTIKLYCWENHFGKIVQFAREKGPDDKISQGKGRLIVDFFIESIITSQSAILFFQMRSIDWMGIVAPFSWEIHIK